MSKRRAAASTALGVTVATLGIGATAATAGAAPSKAPQPRTLARAKAGATLGGLGYKFARGARPTPNGIDPYSTKIVCAHNAPEDCFTITYKNNFIESMSVSGYYSHNTQQSVCATASFTSGPTAASQTNIRLHNTGCAETRKSISGTYYRYAISDWVTAKDFTAGKYLCGRYKFTINSQSTVNTPRECIAVP